MPASAADHGEDTVDEADDADQDSFVFALTQGVALDLADTSAQVVAAGELGLTLTSVAGIEVVTGTAHNDVIYGNRRANTIQGQSGDDAPYGREGDDILEGGLGDDWTCWPRTATAHR